MMKYANLLKNAANDILDWGSYADEETQEEYGLKSCAASYAMAAVSLEQAVPREREATYWRDDYEKGLVDGWNQCRAQMLKAVPFVGVSDD
jgi:hypothetical protein